MSDIVIQPGGAAPSITITIPGTQGPAGLKFRTWSDGTSFISRDAVPLEGSSYRCILAHTASSITRPGTGASWETVWAVLAAGGDDAYEIAVSYGFSGTREEWNAATNAALVESRAIRDEVTDLKDDAEESAESAEAWAQSESPPDPEDPTSKSARGWADTVGGDPLPFALSDEVSPLEVGTAKTTWRTGAFHLDFVRASLTNEQVAGSLVTLDVKWFHEGVWTSIFTTPITFNNGARTNVGATTPQVLLHTDFPYDSEFRGDVLQVGDGSAKGAKIYMEGRRT